MANPIPAGFTAVTPYLVVPDVEREMAFLERAVGAQQVMVMPGPGGKIFHAEVSVNGARIMIGRASEQHPAMAAFVYIYLPDVDAAFARAMAVEGTTESMPVADQFYGDRSGTVKSAGGVSYGLATHTEDLTPDQIRGRMGK